MRAFIYGILVVSALASVAKSAALSESELKNLLAAIRQNRTTQADFQEQRVIRLMKKPILSSGKVWFQPPNKFRREVKGSSPSLTVSDGRQLWIYYPNFKSAERYPLGKGSPLDSTVAAINSSLNLDESRKHFPNESDKIDPPQPGYDPGAGTSEATDHVHGLRFIAKVALAPTTDKSLVIDSVKRCKGRSGIIESGKLVWRDKKSP